MRPLSLIETAVQALDADPGSHFGLIASPTTIQTRLYNNALKKSLKLYTLNNHEQKVTARIIGSVVAGESVDRNGLQLQIDTLRSRHDLDKIILGCTELSAINQVARFSHVIDPLQLICKVILKDKV